MYADVSFDVRAFTEQTRLDEAEKAYAEALGIGRKVAKKHLMSMSGMYPLQLTTAVMFSVILTYWRMQKRLY